MQKCFSRRTFDLSNELRTLWEQHVFWTRSFIISTAAALADLEPVTARLLRNPVDFCGALVPFYGSRQSGRFRDLLTEHLKIGGDLVTAAKNNQPEKVDEFRKQWYANADQIARFLAEINPHWNEGRWRAMLYDHLEMTEQEAVLRLSGQFAEDIQKFDQIEAEALTMADYMAQGMARQFCL